MPSKKWTRSHYRHQPRGLREILINDHLSKDLPTLKRYLKKYPNNYVLHSSIADILWKAGSKRKALIAWKKTVTLFPKASNPFFQRALWALKAHDFTEAAKYLRLCLKKDRGYFRETAHFWRAECLFKLGLFTAAKKELEQVSDNFGDSYFPGYSTRKKADLLNDIAAPEQ